MVCSRLAGHLASALVVVVLGLSGVPVSGLDLFDGRLKADLSSGLSFYNVDVEGDADGFMARTRRGNDLKLSIGSTIVTRTRVAANGRPGKDVSVVLEMDDGLYPSLRKLNLRWTPGDWYMNLGNRHASLPAVSLPMDMRSQFGISLGRARRGERFHLSAGRLTTQFTRDTFFGDETVGPYFLSQELIVSGSETVRVDNARLYKGNDYTIDYKHGTVTFLRPVRQSERVTVDYEYDSFFGVGSNQVSGASYRRRVNRWLTAGISGAYQQLAVAGDSGELRLDHRVGGLDIEVAPPDGGYSLKCEGATSFREETGLERRGEAFKAQWRASVGGTMHTGLYEEFGTGFSTIGWAGERNDRKLLRMGFAQNRPEGVSWRADVQEHTTVQDRQTGLQRERELGSMALSFKASRRRRIIVEFRGEAERWRDRLEIPGFDRRRSTVTGNCKWRVRGCLLSGVTGWEREREVTGGARSTERFTELSARGRTSRYLVSSARLRRTDVSSSMAADSYRNLYHIGCQTERLFTCRLDGVVTLTEASELPRWRELVSRITLDSEPVRRLRLEARFENRRKEVPDTGARTGSSAWTGGARLNLAGTAEAEASYSIKSTAGQSWRHERVGKVAVNYTGFEGFDISLGREMYSNKQAAAGGDYDGSVSYFQAMARF